jgi:cell division protein FtsQ
MKAQLLRIGIVIACAALLVTCAAFAPWLLRRWSAFDVMRVEVEGARHLSAATAVAASGIRRTSSVFDDPAPWREALLTHPLVADAYIERRLPNTIVLRITETTPVAFARTPELRAIDARGRVLPANPAADDMDLPVLTHRTRVSATGIAEDEATLRAAVFLDDVRRHEPGLLSWISEIGAAGDAVRLVLRNATDAEVLVPAKPAPERLRELLLTLGDLSLVPVVAVSDSAPQNAATPTYLSRVRRIDVRFHDQIVVALHRGKN